MTGPMDERRSRLDRVNRALQEVLGEELELIDDDDLHLVTVTGVHVEPDLRHATVWFSSLVRGEPEQVVEALGRHRGRLQAAIGRQLRLKRTPELVFGPDPAIETGTRVEEILKGLRPPADRSERPGPEDGAYG